MNKLKITLGIVAVLLIVIVTAQILSIRNIDVELTRTEKNKLAEYNIINPETSELVCDATTCKYSFYQTIITNESFFDDYDNTTEYYLKEVRYGLGTHTIERGDLSRLELENIQKTQITEFLKGYVQTLENREAVQDKEIISNKTQITIKEQKL